MKRNLYIFGYAGTGKEIKEALSFCTNLSEFKAFFVVNDSAEAVDENFIIEPLLEKKVDLNQDNYYILSMANHNIRTKCHALASQYKLKPLSVVHPQSYISKSARISNGCYIAAGSIISANAAIRDNSIINYHTTIGHDSVIGSDCIINPGARISGNVTVADRVLVGANSFIFQGISIGNDTVIDAMTYIDRNIAANQICSSKNLKVFKRVI